MVTRLIVVIIFKCLEILNHYVVYQELIQCCRSIKLQKPTKKLTEKEVGSVVPGGKGGGTGNWMQVAKRYKLPVRR